MLGLEEREPRPEDLDWGGLEPGSALGVVGSLFPRVEKRIHDEGKRKESTVSDSPPAAPRDDSDRIEVADFARLDLRAAKITAAEKIAGSKKLVKLQVDLGSESRQVVAGIAQTHRPEDLVGKTVVVVANLKPARLMGTESNGMVLAGSVDDRAVLCVFEGEVAPGTKVR
jgi:methionyl-tRNA synthetase